MPYDHSKPEIAAAYKAYQDFSEKHPNGFQCSNPEYIKTYSNYINTLENDGQIYNQTVEIMFPPQLVEQCYFSATIIPIGRVLQWYINDLETTGEHEQAKLYRDVILPFYPDDLDEYDEVDEEDCEDCEYQEIKRMSFMDSWKLLVMERDLERDSKTAPAENGSIA
jgi:hypothetical protein